MRRCCALIVRPLAAASHGARSQRPSSLRQSVARRHAGRERDRPAGASVAAAGVRDSAESRAQALNAEEMQIRMWSSSLLSVLWLITKRIERLMAVEALTDCDTLTPTLSRLREKAGVRVCSGPLAPMGLV